ncbi:uncharacterized protein LOC133825463 [Humulus lupulus]|uniref:uncharacterized protein LOC133825463 n=1 Tax=Humulus lupulus TaxID=3486 RepID=UPI002B404514|nr:uncharacterized protein LOC133825463 [Humulus lupulus]
MEWNDKVTIEIGMASVSGDEQVYIPSDNGIMSVGFVLMGKNPMNVIRVKVKPSNEYLFEVVKEEKSWIVNLKDQTCTCNRFQMDEMPCGHALAVLKEMHLDPYVYYSDYYTTKTWLQVYEATVYPVGNQRTWDVPNYVKEIIVLPLDARVKVGRPKKRSIRAARETKKQNKCSRCG